MLDLLATVNVMAIYYVIAVPDVMIILVQLQQLMYLCTLEVFVVIDLVIVHNIPATLGKMVEQDDMRAAPDVHAVSRVVYMLVGIVRLCTKIVVCDYEDKQGQALYL